LDIEYNYAGAMTFISHIYVYNTTEGNIRCNGLLYIWDCWMSQDLANFWNPNLDDVMLCLKFQKKFAIGKNIQSYLF